MTWKNFRFFFLALAGILFCLALLLNQGLAPFLVLAVFSFLVAIASVSLVSLVYILLWIRPMLDILGNYRIQIIDQLPSVNLAGLVAIISIIVSALILYGSGQKMSKVPFSWLFGLLFLAYMIFGMFSLYPWASVNEIFRVASFLIMYFTGYALVENKANLRQIIWVIIFSSFVPAIAAFGQLLTGQGLYTNPGFDNRIAGTFGHPNVLGYFLLIVIALMIYIYYERIIHNLVLEWVFLAYLGLLMSLLLATYTRGAWIGLALLIGGVSIIKYPAKTLLISSLVIPFITLAAASYIWVESNIWISLPQLEDNAVIVRVLGLFSGDPSDSIIWRQVIWSDMYNQALSRPWLGHGTGTIELITEQVRGLELGALEVHNDYIRIFVEMGLVGLSVYSLFILGIIYLLIRRLQSHRDTLLLIMIFITLAIYLSSAWDNLLRQTAVMWIFFCLLGAIVKYSTIRPALQSSSPTDSLLI